jgi:hypothetical protein
MQDPQFEQRCRTCDLVGVFGENCIELNRVRDNYTDGRRAI